MQGKTYHLVLDGQPGLPYGSTRGLSGLQARSMSCKPFWGGRFNAGMRSQECSIDLSKFVRAEGTEFYLGCDRVTYTGANTWDLMDIARFPERCALPSPSARGPTLRVQLGCCGTAGGGACPPSVGQRALDLAVLTTHRACCPCTALCTHMAHRRLSGAPLLHTGTSGVY